MTNDISSGSSENMTLAKLGLFSCFLYSQDAIKYTPWPCSNCQQKSDFYFCISRFDPHWFYTSGQPKIKKSDLWFEIQIRFSQMRHSLAAQNRFQIVGNTL